MVIGVAGSELQSFWIGLLALCEKNLSEQISASIIGHSGLIVKLVVLNHLANSLHEFYHSKENGHNERYASQVLYLLPLLRHPSWPPRSASSGESGVALLNEHFYPPKLYLKMNNRTKFEFGTGSYRPRTDDSKKISNPEWIFKLLQRDGLPEGPACDACSNLILLFIEGGKPRRTVHSRVSKNALQHKEKLPELANSSIKCGLCALMLASCNTYLSRARLNNIVASGNWYSSSEAVGSENEPFRVMLEECFGSGKLISELRVTIRLYPDRHITDNLLRVYTDAGKSFCHFQHTHYN